MTSAGTHVPTTQASTNRPKSLLGQLEIEFHILGIKAHFGARARGGHTDESPADDEEPKLSRTECNSRPGLHRVVQRSCR